MAQVVQAGQVEMAVMVVQVVPLVAGRIPVVRAVQEAQAVLGDRVAMAHKDLA